jgi:formate/nitrite transporter FocA (FNT family)
MWKLWAKAMGSKASDNDKEADKVAIIRTILWLFVVITEIHIIANVWLNHW